MSNDGACVYISKYFFVCHLFVPVTVRFTIAATLQTWDLVTEVTTRGLFNVQGAIFIDSTDTGDTLSGTFVRMSRLHWLAVVVLSELLDRTTHRTNVLDTMTATQNWSKTLVSTGVPKMWFLWEYSG